MLSTCYHSTAFVAAVQKCQSGRERMVPEGKQASKKVVLLKNRKNLSQRDVLLPEFSPSIPTALVALLITLRSIIRSRVDLQLKNLALRHQISVLDGRRSADLLATSGTRGSRPLA